MALIRRPRARPAMTAALRAAGRRLAVQTLRIPTSTGHVEAASLRVAGALAAAVRDATNAGQAPLVLAGSCDVAPGVLAGLGVAAVPESHVALLGVRSLSPAAEAQRLRASELHVVGWREGQPRRSVTEALDRLAEQVDRAYVHLDLDALDPSIGRGVVDAPVPGGLTARQLFELLLGVRERFTIAVTTIATYVPANDDGSTLPIAIAAAQLLLGEYR